MSEQDLVEIDFEPVEEKWNRYLLADGVKLRGRLILVRLLGPRGTDKYTQEGTRLAVRTQTLFVASAPKDKKGPPGPPLTREEVANAKAKGKLIEVIESNEPWNTYKIVRSGESFRLRLVVVDIYRIPDRFNEEGEPAYIINHTIIVAPGIGHFPTP